MSKFARGNYSKNVKSNNSKNKINKITIFGKFHQVIYLLSSISCLSLKLLAVIVFVISSSLYPNLQRAITKKAYSFTQFSIIFKVFMYIHEYANEILFI